jgi:hypothetical protein
VSTAVTCDVKVNIELSCSTFSLNVSNLTQDDSGKLTLLDFNEIIIDIKCHLVLFIHIPKATTYFFFFLRI